MSVTRMLTTQTRGAITAATSLARHPVRTAATATSMALHPVRTASMGVGLVKGTVRFGTDLVFGTAVDTPLVHPSATVPAPVPVQRPVEQPAQESAQESVPAHDPRDDLPGPDVVASAPLRPGDLPEPVVIEGEQPAGEEFHTEPKATSRESTHGGPPGDREEIEGYAEEVVTSDDLDIDVVTPVGTTGADVATNPSTAESDLQQPGTPPLLDPALAASVRKESETLRKAADPDRG